MKTRRFLACLLALVMALAMGITSFATEGGQEPSEPVVKEEAGTIVITNAVEGNEYRLYRILDLDTYASNKYSYKLRGNSWDGFVQGAPDMNLGVFAVQENGFVVRGTPVDGAKVETLASNALQYANDRGIAADFRGVVGEADTEYVSTTSTTDEKGETVYTLTFKNLPLGYYMIDSSVGFFVGLDTTAPSVTIPAKNGIPTISKKVQDGSAWEDSTTAKIGDEVIFRTKVSVAKGAENYILHDWMEKGLEFVEVIKVSETGVYEDDTKNWTPDVDYEVTGETETHKASGTQSGDITLCNFEVHFADEKLKAFMGDEETTKDLYVFYKVILTKDAKIGSEGNLNETKLTYGDRNTPTKKDDAKVYTYKFEMIKIGNNTEPITGAKFELYSAKTGGNLIALVQLADVEKDGIPMHVYRVATKEEQKDSKFVSAVIEADCAEIQGLGNGTYYLEETVAPEGYNKLTERKAVAIQNQNRDLVINTAEGKVPTGGEQTGVAVQNRTGGALPSTGGIGTTIFYVLGGILVLGAGVLLVTRRRVGVKK